MNKVVTDYIILSSDTAIVLESEVWRHLPKGWQPIGGVCFDGNRYLQAMVKYKEKKEDVSDGR